MKTMKGVGSRQIKNNMVVTCVCKTQMPDKMVYSNKKATWLDGSPEYQRLHTPLVRRVHISFQKTHHTGKNQRWQRKAALYPLDAINVLYIDTHYERYT